ncbi:RluA family pseudouridine synthase [Ferruginivarius sediminum]|uniref:Pseudouridine synthase n=1 Tax=Ferruginivarius sediminum TaxID=2661937 RepID=A0A369T9E5_9PROT|nr:RluA family pseudouridine synthase [Ferruginivarius sediminum]RDD61951.1 RluA family pseudouridine synthase [Ferruginivarius sediminum]
MDAADPRRIEITAPPSRAGERIDRTLAAALPELSRSRLKALIEAGCLTSDGETIAEASYRVKAGQVFVLDVPPPAPARPQAQAMDLAVVYEDEAVIVVDKPAGLVVHPAPGNPDRTLVNALIAHCGDSLLGIGGERRPGIVHRLDKDTSGLLVAAKTETAHAELVRQFSAREIERVYKAVVWGVPAPTQGELSGNIGRSPHNRKKMAVLAHGGRPAVTRYKVERALANGNAALVGCRLLTGRTHQIRVHLAEAGHPLIGDPLYGRAHGKRLRQLGKRARDAVRAFDRQALHAATLGFRHPVTGAPCRFESRLPTDLARLIEALSNTP